MEKVNVNIIKEFGAVISTSTKRTTYIVLVNPNGKIFYGKQKIGDMNVIPAPNSRTCDALLKGFIDGVFR